jgi:PAS domain S-box-containing protein
MSDAPPRAPRLGWLLLAVALAAAALLALALWYLRAQALHGGVQRIEALAHVIAEQTTRTFQSVDDRLQLAISRLEVLEEAGELAHDTAYPVLQALTEDRPFIRNIWVLDLQGRILLHSDRGEAGRSMADREYFRIYQERPDMGLFIGPLVRSRVTGHWIMTVSRPFRDAEGRLRGVITAAVEPPYFEELWGRIDLGEGGAVLLFRRDGQLLMRSPPHPALLGTGFAELALFREYLPAAPHGNFHSAGSFDGVVRLASYRQLEAYPQLVVSTGSSRDEVLAPWRRFALLTGTVWGLAVAIAAALAWLLHRQAASRTRVERRFRELAQAMPQIVFVTDAAGLVQFVSRRWQELTGAPAEEALVRGWHERLHPADRSATVEHMAQGAAAGQELEHEARLRVRDGDYRWQLLRAVPARESGGAGLSWFGTATDIHELKTAQERLREQSEQLRLAGRLARMGGWRLDVAAQRITWSDEAAAILELAGERSASLAEAKAMFTSASLATALHALQECVAHGTPFDLEVEMVTARGRRVWLRAIAQAVRDAEGRVVAVQGAQQDITARMRMLEEIRHLNATLEAKVAQRTSELARQEALFRTLAEQAPLPFWTANPRGEATFFSRAWYALVGGAPPQWHGDAWQELLHPDEAAQVRANWQRSSAAGTVFAGTRRIRGSDGAYHTTTYRAAPVRDEQGQVAFWVGIDTDITDLMANEAALRLANKQLEAFSYSVSHDLQSPLQRMQSFGKLLEEELHGDNRGKAQHYLTRMLANAETMAQLIEGLLALAHVSEVEVIRAPVNLSEIATGILQRLHLDQPQRRVEWTVEPGLAVLADARLMRSVMENLLGNAWKFTAGRETARIAVGGSPGRGEYYVRDNGAGFDMAYADRLFATFQRLHDADEFPGTGIGLATVARAVSRQGGRIWAQAQPGEGATFFFSLPAA